MEVICLQEAAFFALIEKVVERLNGKETVKHDKWVSGTEAMEMLRIKSKTTLQKLRDGGKIRFSQPERKIVLYDTDSIKAYLESNTYENF